MSYFGEADNTGRWWLENNLLYVCQVEGGALEPRGMETDSNDSQKNAVFGFVVSNSGKKGACRVSGSPPLPHTAPSTDSFDPLLNCIAPLVQHDSDPRSSHF